MQALNLATSFANFRGSTIHLLHCGVYNNDNNDVPQFCE